MKQHLLKSFILLCVLNFFYSCHKDNEKSGAHSIPKAALPYLQIPSGKIFTYKDSATGTIDSIKLLYHQITNEYQPDYTEWAGGMLGYERTYPGYNYEKLEFSMINLRDSSVWLHACTDNLRIQGHVRLSALLGTVVGNLPVTIFTYPVDSLNSYFIGNVTVEGRAYGNVIGTINPGYYQFYWAQNVGIIKISMRKNSEYRTAYLCN